MSPGVFLIVVALVGLALLPVAAAVSAIRTPESAFAAANRGSKTLWIVLSILTAVGPILYFTIVRPHLGLSKPTSQLKDRALETLAGSEVGSQNALDSFVCFCFYFVGIIGLMTAVFTGSWLILGIAAAGLLVPLAHSATASAA